MIGWEKVKLRCPGLSGAQQLKKSKIEIKNVEIITIEEEEEAGEEEILEEKTEEEEMMMETIGKMTPTSKEIHQ